MIKRTIDISNGPTFLSIEHDQLVLQRDKTELARIPCEDVGMLLVDHRATIYTHSVFTRLAHYGAAVVLCGEDHLPAGLILPLEGNELLTQRLHKQIACKPTLKKKLWQQVVRAKIVGQASNLPPDSPEFRKLHQLAQEVQSGDKTNVEGQAARIYWQALLGPGFRRARGGAWPNPCLNYGYTVLRAAVARAIASAGLHASFGLHHQNRGNAFCLADDLLEPLRYLVDAAVVKLLDSEISEINPQTKRELLSLLTVEIRIGEQSGPLMVQLHRIIASLWQCYDSQRSTLDLPTPTT